MSQDKDISKGKEQYLRDIIDLSMSDNPIVITPMELMGMRTFLFECKMILDIR